MKCMARPQKEGLDYFPLELQIVEDDKLLVPLARFGMEGLGVIVRIMMEIYRKSYYYPWGKKEQIVFANRVNVNINLINEIINECVEWGFFNQNAFVNHDVLTSNGFQKRYIEAAKRRKEITMIDDYVLTDLQQLCNKHNISIIVVNANGNRVNVYKNELNDNSGSTEIPQSKEKEKVNRNRKEIKTEQVDNLSPKGDGKVQFADYVFLTMEEHRKLTDLLGEEERDRFYLEYAAWISGQSAKIQKSRSAFLTILNWFRREQKNPRTKANKQGQSRWERQSEELQSLFTEAEARERAGNGNY